MYKMNEGNKALFKLFCCVQATEERKGSNGGETEAVNEFARPYLELKHTPVKRECTEHYKLTGKVRLPWVN